MSKKRNRSMTMCQLGRNDPDLEFMKAQFLADQIKEEDTSQNPEFEYIFVKEEQNACKSEATDMDLAKEVKEEDEVYNICEEIEFSGEDTKPKVSNWKEEQNDDEIEDTNMVYSLPVNQSLSHEIQEDQVFNIYEEIECSVEDTKPEVIDWKGKTNRYEDHKHAVVEYILHPRRRQFKMTNEGDNHKSAVVEDIQHASRGQLKVTNEGDNHKPAVVEDIQHSSRGQLKLKEGVERPVHGRPSIAPRPSRLTERHFIEHIPPTEKKENPTRRCVICYKAGIRRETSFWCPDCKAALCLTGCFKDYHTKLNFGLAPPKTYRRANCNNKRPYPGGAGAKEDKKQINVQRVEDIVRKCLSKEKLNLMNESREVIIHKSSDINSNNTSLIDTATDKQLKGYDRHNECLYCKTLFLNTNRHFANNHQNQIDVSYVIPLPLKSTVRNRQFLRLKRIGNFQHNVSVMSSGVGKLIVLRPSELFMSKFSHDHFVPCPDCAGFVFKFHLRRHHKKCVLKSSAASKVTKRNLLKESRALLMPLLVKNADLEFIRNVVNKLTSTFGMVACNDTLISLLGQHIANSKQSKDVYVKVVTTMQTMGCLLLACRKLAEKRKLMFHELLSPEHLALLMTTVKTLLSSSREDVDRYKLYMTLYPQIITSVFIWRGECLSGGNVAWADKMLKFYYLFAEFWERDINKLIQVEEGSKSCSLNYNHCSSLPLTSDVMNLKNSLTSRMVKLTNELKFQRMPVDHIESLWYYLAETTICLLCLFNPVEFDDIETMTIAEYAVRPDWNVDRLEDYQDRMSSTIAYHLAAKRLVVPTEHSGKVILLTHEIKKAIDILITKRVHTSISPVNPYIFAKLDPNTKSTFKAINCFYNLCIRNGKLNDEIMKNMTKRQYVSYVTQISDMSPSEIEWIRQHLGILNVDYNLAFKNTFAEALHVYDINQVFEECKKELQKEISCKKAVRIKQLQEEINQQIKTLEQTNVENIPLALPDMGKKRSRSKRSPNIGGWPVKKRWSYLEKNYVINYFKEEIRNEEIPGKLKCYECLRNRKTLLSGRNIANVKYFVINEIEKQKRLQEKVNPLFCDLP